MAPTLILNSNNAANNSLSVDVSNYLDLTPEGNMDPYDPGWSNKVISHSLLREGGVLALEDRQAKALTFPLKLNATSKSGVLTLVQQINQCLNSPGATYSWQDTGAASPTIFDSITGELAIKYNYRRAERFWIEADLKLYTQPLGRTGGPRLYASASGVGPLLMITPYASGGGPIIGQSTQAGVSGWGAAGQGGTPSSGVFYSGSPSLAGDAPAQLQVSWVGPLPNTATGAGVVPYVAVSVLPDRDYHPLITAQQLQKVTIFTVGPSILLQTQATSVASMYQSMTLSPGGGSAAASWQFSPFTSLTGAAAPGLAWEGSHRLLAIARASGGQGAMLGMPANTLVPVLTSASIQPGLDWGLYDLGTLSLRASEIVPTSPLVVASMIGTASAAVDVGGLVMLPDSSTWFLNPKGIQPSQYGWPAGAGALSAGQPTGVYTNTLLINDVLRDQFVYAGQSQTSAPNPTAPPAFVPERITQFSRGLVPRPDPKNGLPIIAILGVGQTIASPPGGAGGAIASWSNQQNLGTMAQVAVLERVRFIQS